MDDQVANRSRRQIELERLPVVSIIKGHKYAGFSSCEKKALALGVLANHASDARLRKAAVDLPPGFAVISRAIKVRMAILKIIDRSICRSRIEMRRFNDTD